MHPSLVGARQNPPTSHNVIAVCCRTECSQHVKGINFVLACAKGNCNAVSRSFGMVTLVPGSSLGLEARKLVVGTTLLQFGARGFWHGLANARGRHSS